MNPLLTGSFHSALLAAAIICLSATSAWSYTLIDPCGPTWQDLPLTYQINNTGTSQLSNTAMQDTMVASFESWEEPCCTEFRTQFNGLTDETALEHSQRVVLSFSDNDWPTGFGGPDVVAVTLFEYTSQCQITRAPILFNSYHHQFSLTGASTDLQSIATHEIGHVLGLGHSTNTDSAMYAEYAGGTSMRTLHDVDHQGVCALYNQSCGCQSDAECAYDQYCDAGDCLDIPCVSDSECASDKICADGECIILTCDSDDQCDAGFTCQNQRCRTECAACRQCDGHNDCGPSGYCHNFVHGSRCMITCTSQDQCPGDTECTNISGDDQLYCLPPSATFDDHCPETYDCFDTPPADSDADSDADPDEDGDPDPLCDDVECLSTEVCEEGICVEPTIEVPDRNRSTGATLTSCATSPAYPSQGWIAALAMLTGLFLRRRGH